jgi:hypothetical protein
VAAAFPHPNNRTRRLFSKKNAPTCDRRKPLRRTIIAVTERGHPTIVSGKIFGFFRAHPCKLKNLSLV